MSSCSFAKANSFHAPPEGPRPQGATITGASVIVRNAETGVTQSIGKGFKELFRQGVHLPVASRIQFDMALEVGGVIDNNSLMEIPVMGSSATLLVNLVPGIQTAGVDNYLALHSNAGGSDYSAFGNIGGNSWTFNSSPNTGPGHRTAYPPDTGGGVHILRDSAYRDVAVLLAGGGKVISKLHAKPSLWRAAKGLRKPDGHRGANARPAGDHFSKGLTGDAEDLCPFGHGQSQGFKARCPYAASGVRSIFHRHRGYFTFVNGSRLIQRQTQPRLRTGKQSAS